MTDAVLVFTFSPVQSFIVEARRAADLYVGSRILSELAKAAAQAIGAGNLVYPASLNGSVPNVIVARVPVPVADVKQIAEDAEQALRCEWRRICQTAHDQFAAWKFTDSVFDAIWKRQVDHLWEVFWVAAEEETSGYRDAYKRARAALDAVKRSRLFAACDEPGIKDTLSGRREALHQHGQTHFAQVKGFWAQVGKRTTAAKLRPDGRERLDAIGATK
uniref:type III-B CRISPR-associated protein Cas10/Cmr2 n=1 Tax=uncultured Chloroflexus sp. TaxID=214040 RepID=UPI002632A757